MMERGMEAPKDLHGEAPSLWKVAQRRVASFRPAGLSSRRPKSYRSAVYGAKEPSRTTSLPIGARNCFHLNLEVNSLKTKVRRGQVRSGIPDRDQMLYGTREEILTRRDAYNQAHGKFNTSVYWNRTYILYFLQPWGYLETN